MPNGYSNRLPNTSTLETMYWADRAPIIEAHYRVAQFEYLGLRSGEVFVVDGRRKQHLANSLRRLKRIKALAVALDVYLAGAA